jgi:hypothetical protein
MSSQVVGSRVASISLALASVAALALIGLAWF